MEDFDLDKFNITNEKIKSLITSYQIEKSFDKQEFDKINKELLDISFNSFTEDILIQLKNAANKIMAGEMDYLVKNELSYHNLLWKLHVRIAELAKNNELKEEDYPEDIKDFCDIFSSEKIVYKDSKGNNGNNTNNTFHIITSVGDALGHISSIRILNESVHLEYNDHSPSRTYFLKKLFEKEGWKCSEIKILKDVFTKNDTADNLFFTMDTSRKGLKKTAIILKSLIDIDWIILNSKKRYTQKDIDDELKVLEGIYVLYERYNIRPAVVANAINKIVNKVYALTLK